MSQICVIGTGYVGLTTGACFADFGHQVICMDLDERKIENLRHGIMPIFEPGLEEIVVRNTNAGRLTFTTSYTDALRDARFAFIAVGTPSGSDGEADLKQIRSAAEGIAKNLEHDIIIVNKSTVPIGTGDWTAGIVERQIKPGLNFSVVSNPEFLREGSAVSDCQHPDRIVLGSTDRQAAEEVAHLYLSLRAPIIITDLRTAEMIKYASNAFLATRVSFINEIATICEKLGADVKEVSLGMGYDKRIGHAFLDAGIGWGGSCFPKDVKALAHMASIHGTHPQLLRAVMEINRDMRRSIIQKLRDILDGLDDRVITVFGLSFKPNTDDMRESPALEIIRLALSEGARVRAYDPVSTRKHSAHEVPAEVFIAETAYQAAEGADAVIIATEWNEFKQIDKERLRSIMRTPVVIDGRNIYDPQEMRKLGFVYQGIGRGWGGTGETAAPHHTQTQPALNGHSSTPAGTH